MKYTSGPAKSGRISGAHSVLQDRFLHCFTNAAISATRTEMEFTGHGVFRGLVKQETVANLRQEAGSIIPTKFTNIFNNLDESISRKRGMSKALGVGQSVNRAIFEFLSRRALIATKWHDLELARYSVYLRSEAGATRQTPHTDFDPSKMSTIVEGQPEYGLAKSLTVLQPTKLYFVNAEGVQVPEVLTAGDVVVWFGDVDHCGAEWTDIEAAEASQTFGDSLNFRLFSYVPSSYKPEFLVPWLVRSENRKFLTQVDDQFAIDHNLFDKTDPDKADYCPATFQNYLRYGANMYVFNEAAYSLGIDSFRMRPLDKRRLPRQVEANASGAPCPHFPNVRAEFYETDAWPKTEVNKQLQQLKRTCPFCSKCLKKRPRSSRPPPPSSSSSAFNVLQLKPIEDCIPVWIAVGEKDLADAARSFVAEYTKAERKHRP